MFLVGLIGRLHDRVVLIWFASIVVRCTLLGEYSLTGRGLLSAVFCIRCQQAVSTPLAAKILILGKKPCQGEIFRIALRLRVHIISGMCQVSLGLAHFC